MAGRNWFNMGTLKYVWDDLPGSAATPQVLLIDRAIGEQGPGLEGTQYTIRDEILVARKVGTDEIREWLARGAPIPELRRVPDEHADGTGLLADGAREPVAALP